MPTPLRINPLATWDFYKDTQIPLWKPGITQVTEYYVARGGEFKNHTLFGLQAKILSEFEGQFFTQEDLDEEVENSQVSFYKGFKYPRAQWQHILDKHSGRLPIEIRAVKEGLPIPVKNALMTVESTCEECGWLPAVLETPIQQVWYGSTVTTLSREVKAIIREFLIETADNLDTLLWQLADFGLRGTSGKEEAAIGGAAHLVNFLGTDTKPALGYLHQFYKAPRVSGFSVPASEHSCTTSWGRQGEVDFVRNALEKYPTGILSLVGDSYDIYNFTQEIIGGVFRALIKNRNGKVVVRPDSGDPHVVLPKLLDILADKFGMSINSKGYKVLPPCIGIIWGDGMDIFAIRRLFQMLKEHGWAASVIVVGMGGGLLRKVNRDTAKVAMKGCNEVIGGKDVAIYKDPITDPGKTSFRGRPALINDEGEYRTVLRSDVVYPWVNLLEPVFLNGDLVRTQTLEEIRALAEF